MQPVLQFAVFNLAPGYIARHFIENVVQHIVPANWLRFFSGRADCRERPGQLAGPVAGLPVFRLRGLCGGLPDECGPDGV